MFGLRIRNELGQVIVRETSHIACFYGEFEDTLTAVGTTRTHLVPGFDPLNMKGHFACLEYTSGPLAPGYEPMNFSLNIATGSVTVTLENNPNPGYPYTYLLRVWL